MPPRNRRKIAAVPDVPAGGLARDVQETVEKLALQPEDVAVAAVAVKYAETIDRAAAIAAQAARIPFSEDTAEEVKRLAARVSAHSTMADIGPKLLAALDALGATPKARAAAGKPAPTGGKSRLTALREGLA
ncbi:MAG: hypothetical protein AB7L91_18420 [Dehalococcoidia bacterium]